MSKKEEVSDTSSQTAYEWKTARGAQHWEYEGETLLERWQRMQGEG